MMETKMDKTLPNGLVYLENVGVVVGQSHDGKILAHVGPEHVLVMGPTRCGKGVNTVIPTALTWTGSAFFLDYKGEIWHLTSGYRKNVLGQKVMKIDPASIDESHADEVIDEAVRAFCDSDEDVSLYLSGSIKDILATKEVVRKFVDKLLQALLPDEHKKRKGRTLVVLDEFPQLGRLESIETALAISAGNGIKMCLVCQDVNQLNKEYTKDNSIAANCHAHVYFTPQDEATAEAISRILGNRTVEGDSRGVSGGTTKVMTPDEVARMGADKVLMLVAGYEPMMLDKFRYYMDRELSGKVTDPPQE